MKGEPGSSPSLRYGASPASNYSTDGRTVGESLGNEERLSFRTLRVRRQHFPDSQLVTGETFVKAANEEIPLLHIKIIAIRQKARWERDYTNFLLFIMCC